MTHEDDTKAEQIKVWRGKYVGNSSDLEIIEKFEHDFKGEKAV